MHTVSYEKLKQALSSRLLTASSADWNYGVALAAIDFTEKQHPGFRKGLRDGVRIPSFQHQLEVALHVWTLRHHLRSPALALTVALLHDTLEDTTVTFLSLARLFGAEVATCCGLLNKNQYTGDNAMARYASGLATCPTASVVKGADRINNLQGMLGAFSLEKQRAYAAEARTLYLPMLQQTRQSFPDQEDAYESLTQSMASQLQLFGALHEEQGLAQLFGALHEERGLARCPAPAGSDAPPCSGSLSRTDSLPRKGCQ